MLPLYELSSRQSFLICTADSPKKRWKWMNWVNSSRDCSGEEEHRILYVHTYFHGRFQLQSAYVKNWSLFEFFFLTFVMVSKIAFLHHFNLNSSFRLLQHKCLNFAVSLHWCKSNLYIIIHSISILHHRYEWHLWY